MQTARITRIWECSPRTTSSQKRTDPLTWCVQVEIRRPGFGWNNHMKKTGRSPTEILENLCQEYGETIVNCEWPDG